MKIKDRVVLVTGSNRGLGRALVEELLARGAKSVYAASRSGNSGFSDPRVVHVALDLTNPSSIAAAVAKAPNVQLLLNNAGVFSAGPVLSATRDQLRGDMDVNYYGLLDVVRAFRPTLQRTKGAIVNVLSVLSLANWSTFGGYAATKAAAWSLTQALRFELRGDGIAVHAAFPGLMDTDMVKDYPGDKATPQQIAKGTIDGIEANVLDIAPDATSAGALATYLKNPNDLLRMFQG
jgi:NAD(P)-dependent dehydrogenase (short-subunit alcohol dehydrogenase family)